MFRIFSWRWSQLAVLGVGAALVASCTLLDSRPPEEIVRDRAQQRWDALLKGDIQGGYAFLSPGSRAVMTLDGYRTTIRPGFWKAAKVGDVKCGSAESCEVQAEIEYVVRGSRVKTPLGETWIRQQGNWWYVLK